MKWWLDWWAHVWGFLCMTIWIFITYQFALFWVQNRGDVTGSILIILSWFPVGFVFWGIFILIALLLTEIEWALRRIFLARRLSPV